MGKGSSRTADSFRGANNWLATQQVEEYPLVMAFPKRNELELPILIEIEAAGGEIRPTAAFFKELATYFPQLTNSDLRATNKTGINTWENRVHWARLKLVHQAHVDRSRYGVWSITDRGRVRIKSEVGDLGEIKKKKESVHSKLARQIEEIGHMLGKYARREHQDGPYKYDVIWKEAESFPRITHVFEVQDKGNVVEALARLKHAFDGWGAHLFLVVTGEKDRSRVEKLVAPLISGTFHEISSSTIVLRASDIDELHSTFTHQRETIARFFTR